MFLSLRFSDAISFFSATHLLILIDLFTVFRPYRQLCWFMFMLLLVVDDVVDDEVVDDVVLPPVVNSNFMLAVAVTLVFCWLPLWCVSTVTSGCTMMLLKAGWLASIVMPSVCTFFALPSRCKLLWWTRGIAKFFDLWLTLLSLMLPSR